uniref:Uncharacterized protein n=1 Tax=Magallana gigas TaxID=29159 RepID=A0A8W8P3K8_MAGGI
MRQGSRPSAPAGCYPVTTDLKQVIVHEKHVNVLKKMSAFVVIKYTTLKDGTLKIGQQTVVMQTKKPDALTEEMIVSFVKSDVVEELGRISSFENKKRISVTGEITKLRSMSSCGVNLRRLVSTTELALRLHVFMWICIRYTVPELNCRNKDSVHYRESFTSSRTIQRKKLNVHPCRNMLVSGHKSAESLQQKRVILWSKSTTCTRWVKGQKGRTEPLAKECALHTISVHLCWAHPKNSLVFFGKIVIRSPPFVYAVEHRALYFSLSLAYHRSFTKSKSKYTLTIFLGVVVNVLVRG